MRVPWVLASRNAGKLVELRAIFASKGIAVVDLRGAGVGVEATEEDIESFDSFEENALAKVRYFSARLPGRIIVADDSGLSVDALGGAPGVRSKRWSGSSKHGGALDAENNAALVAAIRSHARRDARFICVAAWTDGRIEMTARGEVMGRIVEDPVGTNGFGYDPHVFVGELGMTMAEASIEEKQRVSHRARAFLGLVDGLKSRALID